MRSSSRRNIDIAVPRVQDFDGEMSRGPESEYAHALSGFHSRNPHTPKTNDAGTEQRRCMQVVERCWKWKYEISPSKRIFRVTAIYGIAGKDGSIAKVLHTSAAVPTASVGAANPRNSDARAGRKVCGGAFHDVANDLMSGNQVLPAWRKFAFHNMQVGAANTAGAYFQQDRLEEHTSE